MQSSENPAGGTNDDGGLPGVRRPSIATGVCLSDPDYLTMSQTVSDFDRRPMTISDSNNGRGVVASEAIWGCLFDVPRSTSQ